MVTTTSLPGRTEVPQPQGMGTNYTQGGMTFLEMVRRLRQECGVSGSDPASVVNLTGEHLRLKNYINQAWMDIQTLHTNWKFMQQDISFVTQAGKQRYSTQEMLIASFGSYKKDCFTIYPEGDQSQEQDLPYMEYDKFKRMYMFGSMATQLSKPYVFSESPQGDILLGNTPDTTYRITGEGFAMPTQMANDLDRPVSPGWSHMAIVYKAMMKYGQYEAAPEVLAQGMAGYNELIARLAIDQLPTLDFGGTLA
jgi:hypothetical protein